MSLVQARIYSPPADAFMLRESASFDAAGLTLFPRSKTGLRLTLLASMFILDLTCVIAGFVLGGVIRHGSIINAQELRTLAIVVPTFIPIALNSRAYSIEALKRPTFGARKALEALLYASAVALCLLFYMKISADFSRVLFALGTLFSVGLILLGRLSAGQIVGRYHKWQFSNELVLADGVDVPATRTCQVVSPAAVGIDPTVNHPLTFDRLGQLAANCDRLVIACSAERRADWMHATRGTNFNVEIAMPELGSMGATGLGRFEDDVTLLVNSGGLTLRNRILKRSFDIIVATLALIAFTPLMVLTAAAIVLESPGPVLFRQRRVGQNSRFFSVLKFRSMRVECTDCDGKVSASTDDQRLTRVGKFIRKTSIDELPQLLNVIAGDMSLVGPRPHALGSTAENRLFWDIDRRYWNRHALQPGITGLAQVRGFRGATLQEADLTSRLEHDLEYVAGWSIWRDLKILAATVRVLAHPNAY